MCTTGEPARVKEASLYQLTAWGAAIVTSATDPAHGLLYLALAQIGGGVAGVATRWAWAGPDDPQSIRTIVGGLMLSAGISALAFGFTELQATVVRVFGIAWIVGACAEYWPRFRKLLGALGERWLKKREA